MNRFKIGVMADWLGGPFRHNIETSAAMGAQGVQLYATGEFSDFTPRYRKGRPPAGNKGHSCLLRH